jgi:hypothetical protein
MISPRGRWHPNCWLLTRKVLSSKKKGLSRDVHCPGLIRLSYNYDDARKTSFFVNILVSSRCKYGIEVWFWVIWWPRIWATSATPIAFHLKNLKTLTKPIFSHFRFFQQLHTNRGRQFNENGNCPPRLVCRDGIHQIVFRLITGVNLHTSNEP